MSTVQEQLATFHNDEQTTRFREWCETVVVDEAIKGGEPVFPNTRSSVRHIAVLLARGDNARREVLEDHPYLSEEDVEFATLLCRCETSTRAASPEVRVMLVENPTPVLY